MSAPLTPWQSGFGMLEPFRKEMEEMMQRFFGDATTPTRVVQSWTPRVDVEETEKEILVKADLPGVDPKNIEISIENGLLTVRGEKKEEKEDKQKNYHRIERFTGSFQRTIALPSSADPEKVTATSTHGVVTITIPKKAEAQPKRIVVTPK
jgi:HSP20 family protein